MTTQPTPAGAGARTAPGILAGTRLMTWYGLVWEVPVKAPATEAAIVAEPETGPAPPAQPPPLTTGEVEVDVGPHPSLPVARANQVKSIGQPILPAHEDDTLGSTFWSTQPQLSADGGSLGALTVRAASVAGRHHARRGETREDAFAVGSVSDGTVVIAVADGVGSPTAKYAAVGAHVTSVLSCNLVAEMLKQGSMIDPSALCAELSKLMVESANRYIVGKSFSPVMLSTTLITVWVTPDGVYRGFMVGDGGIFELAPGVDYWATRESAQSLKLNDVDALPSAYSTVTSISGRLHRGGALLVATDGLAVPLRSPDVAMALGASWQRPPAVLDFLYDVSFQRRGEADDRTGVCVWFDPDPEH